MSHPYADHYPGGSDTNQRLDDHEKRIKEIESKLGAASTREAAIREVAVGVSARGSMEELSTATAPSVSGYIRCGTEHQQDDIFAADRLAAAVTAFCEREWSNKGLDQAWDLNMLGEIAFAFVRGEPLPKKEE